MKIFYFDLETTGLNPDKNGIHQLSFIIEINGEITKSVNVNIQPFPTDEIQPDALKVANVTQEQIFGPDYLLPQTAYKRLVATIEQYVKRYDKTDKFFLAGYNSQSFDSQFLRKFFEKNNDKYFGSYFWTANLDVMILAAQRLINQRPQMPDFKLATVAKTLGIQTDDSQLHNAYYDLHLTRQIYKKVTA